MTLWTVAHHAPLSMGFSRQEYWSGLPFVMPSPGNLSDPETVSCVSCIAGRFFTAEPLGNILYYIYNICLREFHAIKLILAKQAILSSFKKSGFLGYPGGTVVRNLDTGLIPGLRTKIPHAAEQLSQCITNTEPVSRTCVKTREARAMRIPSNTTRERLHAAMKTQHSPKYKRTSCLKCFTKKSGFL